MLLTPANSQYLASFSASYRLSYRDSSPLQISLDCNGPEWNGPADPEPAPPVEIKPRATRKIVKIGRRAEQVLSTPVDSLPQHIAGKKEKPAKKPKYIVGMSLEGQIALVSKNPAAIRKLPRPHRLVQLAAARKDVRARHWLNGPVDESVQIYIQHKLNKSNKYAASNDNAVPAVSAAKPAKTRKLSAKIKSANSNSPSSQQERKRAKRLSQFYSLADTGQCCARQVMQFLPSNKDYVFFEPSAGYGVFIDAVRPFGGVTGIDIDPKREDIPVADFLRDDMTPYLPKGATRQNLVVIGNPPFGKNSADALKFLNKALVIGSNVAFILPKSFRKYSFQNKIDQRAKLVLDVDLPSKSFIHMGKRRQVDCCFQVWTIEGHGQDLRIRSKPATKHEDFAMKRVYADKPYPAGKWDIAIQCSAWKSGQFVEKPTAAKLHGKYWILVKGANKVLNRFRRIDFNALATRVSVNIKSLSYGDIVSAYEAQVLADQRDKVANDNAAASGRRSQKA